MQAALRELVDQLWQARRRGATVPRPDIGVDEGMEVLRELAHRAVGDGDEVIGWKIARVPNPATDREPVFFAGPVFASSLGPRDRTLVAPQLEVEFVARLATRSTEPDSAVDWAMSWHVGFEVVDNHDDGWTVVPGWAVADWSLHAGAVLGDTSPTPRVHQPITVRLRVGDEESAQQGAWRTGTSRMLAILQRDCHRLLRPCQPGDLIWSGALVQPVPLPLDVDAAASIADFGSVTLSRDNFWLPETKPPA